MSPFRRASFVIAALAPAAFLLLISPGPRHSEARGAVASARPEAELAFGGEFWKHWGDGKGELSGYDLTTPRYGQLRKGIAITVFVTETFSNSLRVKSDPGRHPKADEFPVLKLNLVEDFATGIYDYNLLTSVFVALSPVNGRPAGAPTKVAFSSQEWCGGVWSQLLFDAGSVRSVLHSYFDGEADQSRTVAVPPDALSEDALLLWARGLAAPLVRPGERREAQLVRSLESARMNHKPVDLQRAVLSRDTAASRVTVPAGTFDVGRATVEVAGGLTWKFWVETAAPHRIIEWESSDGGKASLLGSDRLEYWNLHGEGQESFLGRLGLKPRPPRTP